MKNENLPAATLTIQNAESSYWAETIPPIILVFAFAFLICATIAWMVDPRPQVSNTGPFCLRSHPFATRSHYVSDLFPLSIPFPAHPSRSASLRGVAGQDPPTCTS